MGNMVLSKKHKENETKDYLQTPDNMVNGHKNYIHNPSQATHFQLIRNKVQT